MQKWFIGLLVRAAPVVMAATPVDAHHGGEKTPHAVREAVTAAAGTEAGLLVITPTGVKVLDAAGGARRAPWRAREWAWQRRPAPVLPASPPWPGLTGDADFTSGAYDADDIDDGDDPRLADDATPRSWDIDEGAARNRSVRPAAGGPAPRPLVVAVGDAGWILREDGVWKVRLRDSAATLVHPCEGRRVRALAAGGAQGPPSTVALVDGDHILRAKDGGAFERIGGPVPRAQALAILGPATVVVLDGSGGLRAYPGATPGGTVLFRDGVDDIVTCGPQVLVLRDDDLFAVGDTGLRRAGGAPPGTERLACDGGGGTWVAFGRGLHQSSDGGRTWTLRPSSAVRPILAAVPMRAALWLVVPAGLWPLPPVQHAAAAPAPAGPRVPPLTVRGRAMASDPRGGPSSFWRRWAALLPEVDVDFEIGRVGPVREVRGLLAASFRLDGLWSGQVPSRARARGMWDVRPDVGATAELDTLAVDAGDAIATAERRALARILEEPP